MSKRISSRIACAAPTHDLETAPTALLTDDDLQHERQLIVFLAALGASSSAVANSLAVNAVGRRGRTDDCPLVLHLRHQFSGWHYRCCVGVLLAWRTGGATLAVPLTDAVLDFFVDFDAGRYPDMERRPAGAG